MHGPRVRNLLGAAALTVGDLLLAAATAASGVSASGTAALVVLSTTPGLSVTELGRRVGLSQPAAARMVDTLIDHGLARRRATPTRSVSVHLTAEGTAAADRVLSARDDVLADLIRPMDGLEQQTLGELLSKLLDAGFGQMPHSALLCRLCDRARCVAESQACPVGQAERRRRMVTDHG